MGANFGWEENPAGEYWSKYEAKNVMNAAELVFSLLQNWCFRCCRTGVFVAAKSSELDGSTLRIIFFSENSILFGRIHEF